MIDEINAKSATLTQQYSCCDYWTVKAAYTEALEVKKMQKGI